MSKSTRNTGAPWTRGEVAQMRRLAKGNTPSIRRPRAKA
jgi:hypothetical protein